MGTQRKLRHSDDEESSKDDKEEFKWNKEKLRRESIDNDDEIGTCNQTHIDVRALKNNVLSTQNEKYSKKKIY